MYRIIDSGAAAEPDVSEMVGEGVCACAHARTCVCVRLCAHASVYTCACVCARVRAPACVCVAETHARLEEVLSADERLQDAANALPREATALRSAVEQAERVADVA